MRTLLLNLSRLGFILFLITLFSCSKEGSDGPDSSSNQGEIHVVGDVAVEGSKKIKTADFEYKNTGVFRLAIYINGESDGTAISGFNLSFNARFLEEGEEIPVGTYKYVQSSDKSPYFEASYEDTYESSAGDFTYMSFHANEGELKISESSSDQIKGEFTMKASYAPTGNSVEVKGKFTARKRSE